MASLQNNLLLFGLSFVIIFYQCTDSKKQNNIDQNTKIIEEKDSNYLLIPSTADSTLLNNYVVTDTTQMHIVVHFTFNGVSNEGGEGYAYYNKITKQLNQISLNIYAERGQSNYNYKLNDNKVSLVQKEFIYLTPIGNIKNDDEIQLDTTIIYSFNLEQKGLLDGITTLHSILKIIPLRI